MFHFHMFECFHTKISIEESLIIDYQLVAILQEVLSIVACSIIMCLSQCRTVHTAISYKNQGKVNRVDII